MIINLITFLIAALLVPYCISDLRLKNPFARKPKSKLAKIGTPPILKTREENEKDIENLIEQLFKQTKQGKK